MRPTKKECGGAMNDVDDSDHELTDEQRDKLRKAIGEIIGDFTPWIFVCIFDHDDNHRNDKNSKGITNGYERE